MLMPSKAGELVSKGGIIAFRTDTFYGLGVDPLKQAAVEALIKLKGREEGKPILVIVSDPEYVDHFIAKRSHAFNQLVSKFWPGPLTLVGQAHAHLSRELTAGTGTVGVRLPNDDRVRELVRVCGGALTGTSANVSGAAPSRNAVEVRNQFPAGIDLIIDDGEVEVTEPSTVIDVTTDEPRLIREGAIPWEILQASQNEK